MFLKIIHLTINFWLSTVLIKHPPLFFLFCFVLLGLFFLQLFFILENQKENVVGFLNVVWQGLDTYLSGIQKDVTDNSQPIPTNQGTVQTNEDVVTSTTKTYKIDSNTPILKKMNGSPNTLFIIRKNSLGAFLKPKGKTNHSKCPDRVAKAVFQQNSDALRLD
jgi:hypothetical protein